MGLTAECTIPSALCDILDAKAERFAALPPFYKSVNVEPLQSNLLGYLVSWLLFEPLDQTDQGKCRAVLHTNLFHPLPTRLRALYPHSIKRCRYTANDRHTFPSKSLDSHFQSAENKTYIFPPYASSN